MLTPAFDLLEKSYIPKTNFTLRTLFVHSYSIRSGVNNLPPDLLQVNPTKKLVSSIFQFSFCDCIYH